MKTDKEFLNYLDAVVTFGQFGLTVTKDVSPDVVVHSEDVIDLANELRECAFDDEFDSDIFFRKIDRYT